MKKFTSGVLKGDSGSILFLVLYDPIVFGINLFSFDIKGEKSGLIKFIDFFEEGLDTDSEFVVFLKEMKY